MNACVDGQNLLPMPQNQIKNSPHLRGFFYSALHEYFFMIKLTLREMKNLSRILTTLLCIAPMINASVAAPVATTSGSNLTSFNPSTANNNQWATMTNGRYDTNTTAKTDFGNCNAVILRCAQPKCGNGGCTDYAIAGPIVEGCVKSNTKCKKFGDDLINSMTAQLVASSNAKLQEQQNAIEMARVQAEAQAAAAAAASNAQSQQVEMMQQQMAQMQQQMAQQQAESAAQLQAALAQQAAQSQAALESMKTAATEAAKETEAGISAYQQEAIDRNISKDVLERQKISGQIFTQIQDAETLLQSMKKSMQNAFEYAGCDARGNSCTGPKRIKKWRELAKDFFEPYDGAIDKIYDALITAQTVGINMSQIYMMLNDSCNQWGQYLCAKSNKGDTIIYPEKTAPHICAQNTVDTETGDCKNPKPCTLLKPLTSDDDVYEGWIEPEDTDNTKVTVVACASGALNSATIFSRRTKAKNGAGLVDIDALELWLNQVEPNKVFDQDKETAPVKYCSSGDSSDETIKAALQQAVLSRSVGKTYKLCVDKAGEMTKASSKDKNDECAYINPVYAICDTHFFNAGYATVDSVKTGDETKINAGFTEGSKEVIGLKITAISQQMYKQYEYIKATLRRIQIQLEKAVLSANLEAAGAQSEDGSSSSGGLAGSSNKTQYSNCSGKNGQETLYCLRQNYSVLEDQVKNCKRAAKEQLYKDTQILKSLLRGVYKYTVNDNSNDLKVCGDTTNGKMATNCEECLQQYSTGLYNLEQQNYDDEAKRQGRYYSNK